MKIKYSKILMLQFFAYYGKSKPKEIKCQIKYVMLKYICAKKYIHHKIFKKCKHIQKMIEMIFNFYENCSMY